LSFNDQELPHRKELRTWREQLAYVYLWWRTFGQRIPGHPRMNKNAERETEALLRIAFWLGKQTEVPNVDPRDRRRKDARFGYLVDERALWIARPVLRSLLRPRVRGDSKIPDNILVNEHRPFLARLHYLAEQLRAEPRERLLKTMLGGKTAPEKSSTLRTIFSLDPTAIGPWGVVSADYDFGVLWVHVGSSVAKPIFDDSELREPVSVSEEARTVYDAYWLLSELSGDTEYHPIRTVCTSFFDQPPGVFAKAMNELIEKKVFSVYKHAVDSDVLDQTIVTGSGDVPSPVFVEFVQWLHHFDPGVDESARYTFDERARYRLLVHSCERAVRRNWTDFARHIAHILIDDFEPRDNPHLLRRGGWSMLAELHGVRGIDAADTAAVDAVATAKGYIASTTEPPAYLLHVLQQFLAAGSIRESDDLLTWYIEEYKVRGAQLVQLFEHLTTKCSDEMLPIGITKKVLADLAELRKQHLRQTL